MTRSYKNADGSFRSDPMIPKQLENYHTGAEACTLNFSLLRLWYQRLFLEGGEKLIAGQAFPCSISSDNDLGSWHG